jgi:DedD protein
MSDEGFHEIQLNGKQLVFLFMAATVVSVVIFLCGVMVGRGVRAQQVAADPATEVGATAATEESPRPEPSRSASERTTPSTPTTSSAQGATAPPEPAEDGSDYFKQLTDAKPEAVPPVAPADATQKRADATPPAAERPVEKASPPPIAAPAGAVTGDGFVVQVAALRDRTEADAIVKRLAGKGYQAFVVNPVPGKPPVYKVQVGRFAERGDAEKTAARLKSQEQYSPWVTR